MSFQHTTRSQFRSMVAARLGDPGMVFFVSGEIGRYVNEALRSWNAATLYHRARGTFQTTPATTFYDLGPLLSDGSSYLVERTLTDADLVADIKYALMEPTPTDTSTFSEQFSLSDILSALQKRRDQFLIETGQIVSTLEQSVSPGDGRVSLPDSVLDVRRAAWLTYDGDGNPYSYTNLWKTDDYALDSQRPGWRLSPGAPDSYTLITSPQTTLQLAPYPTDIGKVHLLYLAGSSALTGAGVALNVLQDYAHYVKWGALADLLSGGGQAPDPARAEYCEQRFKEGIELSKIGATVLTAEVNGYQVPLSNPFQADAHNPTWQGARTAQYGEPDTAVMAGLNLVGLTPTPGVTTAVTDGHHSVVMDVVRNAPVPTGDDDYIQVGREYLDVLADYTCHLALFKCGGEEFAASQVYYKRAMEAAKDFNSRLAAASENFEVLKSKSQKESEDRPLRREAA